jgi:hypothetical protein
MKHKMSLPRVYGRYRWLSYTLVWSWRFALVGLGAGDQGAEQQLNEIYTKLRHTLTPREKEQLKQEELDWLKQRGQFSLGDRQRIETAFEPPGTMSYVSPRGTSFQLEKLERPVINDNNRKIDSGDWKVIISGGGDEYLSLKEKLGHPSFGIQARLNSTVRLSWPLKGGEQRALGSTSLPFARSFATWTESA